MIINNEIKAINRSSQTEFQGEESQVNKFTFSEPIFEPILHDQAQQVNHESQVISIIEDMDVGRASRVQTNEAE